MTRPAPIRSVTTIMLAIAAVGAVLVVCWHIWVVPFTDPVYGLFNMGIDTRVYRGGAIAVWDGLPLYAKPVYEVWEFTYPPFAALVMVPLAGLPIHTAKFLWNVGSVISLLLLIGLSLRALRFRFDARFVAFTVLVAVFATSLEPVHTTLWNGQINLVLALFVVADLALRNHRLQGLGVGLAAGIKLTPLFFVAHLVTVRKFRAAIVAVAVFVGTVLIGIAVLGREAIDFWTGDISDTKRIGSMAAPANQSFNGFFARLGTMDLAHPPTWLWVPVGLVVGLLSLWAAYCAYQAGGRLLAVAITGMASCAVSPFSWGHHWVWILPLLLVAFVHAYEQTRREDPRTWLWWLAPASIVTLTFTYWQAMPLPVPGHPGKVFHGMAFGSFRGFGSVDGPAWQVPFQLIGSGAYLIVLLGTIAVTLWWTRRVEPIRSAQRLVESDDALPS
ncbi:glycosyltransferase 87 family protein [Gordonia malaquae]|uniref:glycosyltransferase 87 family protein n=1 Tax=Gordonia malaquae TaxID=410332 RepID=UPI001CBA62E3|nr:glycosyltransferase 87 family protein [Gordonia malaquae]